MTTNEDERAFARTLFAPDSDGDQVLVDVKPEPRAEPEADDGLDAQRRFAAELFASDPEDAPILAGLKDGKTVGRTTPPRAEDVDQGPWFDRTPAVDDD